MASQGISIAIQLVSTVILSRLLTPEDYGVMAMVMAITAFAGLFRDLGLSSAAIQKKDLTHAQQSNLFWLNVAMGAALTVIVAAASPLVAWFYGKPELTHVTLALSASFIIGGLGTQHCARLVRDMQFARQAIATILGSLVTLAVAVTFAFHGWSYWALVCGTLAGAVTTTLLLFIVSPFRPSLFMTGAGVREMIIFGANVTAFDFVNYFSRNLDNLLIGKFWGSEALGLYSRAYALMMLPINAIRGPINTVAFPAMSKLQADPLSFRQYYRRTTHLIAFVSMPLTAFLFVASHPIISLLLGSEWIGVSRIFAVLAITGFIQPVAGLRGNVLLSCGHGRRYLTWGIINAITVCIGFMIGVHWGVLGMAVSYAIVNYAILYPSLILVFKGTPVAPGDFFRSILIPCIASLAAALTTFLIYSADAFQMLHELSILLILGITFIITYLVSTLAFPGGYATIHGIIELAQNFCPVNLAGQSRRKRDRKP